MCLEYIAKPAPSRTMSSMMSSLKQEDPSAGSSNLQSDSSSSDESKGQDELFKSLKFSDEVLQQMNAKRKEIVGGRNILGADKDSPSEFMQRRGSHQVKVEKSAHIEIGLPLPRQRSVLTKNVDSNTTSDPKCPQTTKTDIKSQPLQLEKASRNSNASEQSEESNSDPDVQKTEEFEIQHERNDAQNGPKSLVRNNGIPTVNLESAEDEKEKMVQSSRKTNNDEISAFKHSLEEDLAKEKEALMKKFQSEIAEEMRKLEDERFEKLKSYELEMTKKLHRELDEFKDNVAKELEEKKKEIIMNQEMVLKELAKSSNSAITHSKIVNQSSHDVDENFRKTKEEVTQLPKQAKNSNAKNKEIESTNILHNMETNIINNYPSPFSKQLEDLEKDIRKLRTQMGSRGGGSVSDYSSFSEGAEIEPIQSNPTFYGEERNVSPDIESIGTYTEDDDMNAEKTHHRYQYRNRYSYDNVNSLGRHGMTNHGTRVSQSFVGEQVQAEASPQGGNYTNQGKLYFVSLKVQ